MCRHVSVSVLGPQRPLGFSSVGVSKPL